MPLEGRQQLTTPHKNSSRHFNTGYLSKSGSTIRQRCHGQQTQVSQAYFFLALNCTPSTRDSLLSTCGLGIAFPLSYSWITLGFSLTRLPSCACVSFLSSLACWIFFFNSRGTLRLAQADHYVHADYYISKNSSVHTDYYVHPNRALAQHATELAAPNTARLAQLSKLRKRPAEGQTQAATLSALSTVRIKHCSSSRCRRSGQYCAVSRAAEL